MLKISWIRKEIKIHSDEWFQGRLAKFTASEFYVFMGEKPFTTGALTYIYNKVGEELSGLAARDEISNQYTEHGHLYEDQCLRELMKIKGLEFIVTQQLISEPDSRIGATPDGLIIHSISSDGLFYNVSTIEAKCPKTYSAFIRLALCKTPADVKKFFPQYYWQCLFQMHLCGALKGYLVCFQPFFKVGGTHVIEFSKIDLREDFKLLVQRLALAEAKFIEIRDEMFNLQPL